MERFREFNQYSKQEQAGYSIFFSYMVVGSTDEQLTTICKLLIPRINVDVTHLRRCFDEVASNFISNHFPPKDGEFYGRIGCCIENLEIKLRPYST